MAQLQTGSTTELVLQGSVSGLTVIPQPTVLTRLNYFDGKFLRASDLQKEQEYLRMLVEASNLGGGAGVVNGFDTMLGTGDQINLGPGLAIDGAGRVLMLPTGTSFGAQDLIDASRRVTPVVIAGATGSATFIECAPTAVSQTGAVATGQDFYLLTIGHAEAPCGEEDVYGRLCEAACATGTDRPYLVEGVVVRAVPFAPKTPLPTSTSVALSGTHLRSQLASAYFADEVLLVASLISKSGLALDTWCLGARLAGGQDVPLAVFVRSGTTTLFLDAWTARRERIEAPARRYWAWRMMMRPTDVYLAQILQFQCQLHDLILAEPGPGGPPDPCKADAQLLSNAAQLLNDISVKYTTMVASLPQATALPHAVGTLLPGGISRLELIRTDLIASLQGLLSRPTNRVLINGGIIELPSAGYLPVDVGPVTVNDQVRKLLGEGLDLRFCVVRPDYVAHALEEAEHMERISLLTGLDHPDAKPKVDILVPNGLIVQKAGATPGTGVSGEVDINPVAGGISLALRGAGRNEKLSGGGWAFEFAGCSEAPTATAMGTLAQALNQVATLDPNAFKTISALNTTSTSAAASILSDPNLAVRLRTLSGSANDFLTTLRILPGRLPVFAPAVAPADRRAAAVWIEFRIEQNPLRLASGDVTPVFVRQVLVSPAATVAVHDQRLQGQLQVTQVTTDPNGNALVIGHFSGVQIVAGASAAGTVQPVATTFDGDVRVTVKYPAGQDPRVEVAVSRKLISGSSQVLTATWSGNPMTVKAGLAVGFDVLPLRTLETATITVDPSVFASGNPDQQLARLALPILGAGLQDPNFAATAERQLFPTPAPDTGEQIVQPTMDWVLFQRRREAECGGAPIATFPARIYQLYSVLAPDLATQNAIRQALLANDATVLKRYGSLFKAVDQPQFVNGASAMATPVASVVADWRGQGPGNVLGWAGIADHAAENAFTAQGRMSSVEQAVASVSAPDPNLASEVIPAIPAQLNVPTTDGIIVLITRQQTVCHTIYRVKQTPADVKAFGTLRAGATTEFGALLGQGLLTRLGNAKFNPGSDVPVPGDGIQGAWNNAGSAAPYQAVVLSNKAATDAGDPTTRATQAVAVGNEIENGSKVQVATDLPVDPAVIPAGDCSVIDVIMPTLRHRVFAVRSANSQFMQLQPPPFLGEGGALNPKFTLAQADFDSLVANGIIAELGNADFDPFNPATALAMPAKKLSSLPTPPWRTADVRFVMCLDDGSALPEGSLVIQAEGVQTAVAVGARANVTATEIQQPAAPVGGATVLTLLLLESQ
jgi:hypothetical protein